MKGLKLILFSISFFGSSCAIGQIQKFLPVLAPPSPEAAAFSRYGNYEVNLFTGIPNISIPLYEIKIGDLNVPISLNYHPSGIKVNDLASRVGLGWDLQAGGSITRKIMGGPDELPDNYLNATIVNDNMVKLTTEINPLTESGLFYLSMVNKGFYDVEPDIFSYSFPGHSGKFLFNQKNNFAPVLIPYAPIKIIKSPPAPYSLLLGIIDESGINYRFDSREGTSTGGGITVACTSAWLLSDMISANKQDTIHFNYNARGGGGTTNSYFSDYLVLDEACGGDYNCIPGGTYGTSMGSVTTSWQQMTQIDFKNGKIVFEAAPESREESDYDMQKRLNSIKIYSLNPINKSYLLIKSINFFHSYFISATDATTKRLRLDSLQISGGTGLAVQTYRFNYNTTVSLPSYNSRMKDYWGYFNNVNNLDPNGNPTLIPRKQIQYNYPPNPPTTIWIGGDHINARDPDPAFMQASILQKITFPAGGSTQFEYETNQYLDDQGAAKYAGGLRIKSIKTYQHPLAVPLVKTYKYGTNETGYGRNNFLLEDHFFVSVQNFRKGGPMNASGGCTYANGLTRKTTSTYFSNPTVDLEGYDGAPVVYPFVTEYIGDGASNAGKTIYTYADKTDAKTSMIGYGKPMLTSYHFVRGMLTNKSDYRNNGANSYSLLVENRKGYQYFPFQSTTGGIGLGVFKSDIFENGEGLNIITACDAGTDSYSYKFNNYEVVTGDNVLVADTMITYQDNDPSKYNSVVTSYTYDDVTHLQVAQTQTVNSKNETIQSAYTHPYNYATAPYITMTSNNIFNKIITDTKTNNANPLTIQTSNYSSFAGNNFLPANIQLKVKTNPVETRASFNQYDLRGNILEMQKTGDIKQSYIWDYQGLLPVAEVTNAGQSDIAYTSFEADGKGNWSYAITPTAPDPTSPTGNKYYTLGASITKSGLSTTTTYIVSYWKKSGTVAVNGTTPITGLSINGWTYYEHKVVNPAGGLITVSGTSGIIDELRLYPSAALMATYTYVPLIGITNNCDVNNRITYYEYDGFNRLMLVRDQGKNILKQICYNYSGQVENCNIFYNSIQNGSINKNNCTSCLVGSIVTYTVPAKTYSAASQTEADQMAIEDIVNNRQAYANNFGTCIAASSGAVTGSNAVSQSYSMTLHNNCTGSNYSFTMPSGVVSNVALGSVPEGNYNVTFSPPAGSAAYTYRINGTYTLRANSGTISNVNFSSSGNTISITP
jgi:Family of unknown function (DUF5977)